MGGDGPLSVKVNVDQGQTDQTFYVVEQFSTREALT